MGSLLKVGSRFCKLYVQNINNTDKINKIKFVIKNTTTITNLWHPFLSYNRNPNDDFLVSYDGAINKISLKSNICVNNYVKYLKEIFMSSTFSNFEFQTINVILMSKENTLQLSLF